MSFKYINNPSFENTQLRSVYNKWQQRQFGKGIPVHVFGSGSEGNSVYLKPYHILIDLGMTYKAYMEYSPTFFLDVDVIILTHHHGDHLNPSTLLRVLDNHPHIKVIISDSMLEYITSDRYEPKYKRRTKKDPVPFGHDPVFLTDERGQRIMEPPKWAPLLEKHTSKFRSATPQTLRSHTGREVLFEPLTVKHGDIINIAIQLLDESLDFNFLYSSDLDNLDGAKTFTDYQGRIQHITGLNQERQYTCMFLEANYDEDILNQWYANLDPSDPDYRAKKVRADGNLRHISEQEASKYIERHLVEGGLFVPLHASKTFGTLYQG